jgi:hypothetical protein
MSEDFGTVNLRRGGRDLELLRRHYQQHRENLKQLGSDAPSEFLASEYQRLIREIDLSLKKIDEMEGRGANATAAAAAAAAVGGSADSQPTMKLNASSRPLTPPPTIYHESESASPNPALRVALILVVGIAVLGLVGWLIWRASTDRVETPRVVDATQPVTNTEAIEDTGTIAPAVPPGADTFKLSTNEIKFGNVRRGTRVVRQIEVTNTSDEAIPIAVARSNCRCLFYEHNDQIKPKAKESVTISLDGARAKVGPLSETLTISSKEDPTVKTSFQVTANIK